jgi:hypothetical protein
MIDIRHEKVFPLTQAAKREESPRRRRNKRPNVATIYRWAKHGVGGVRLQTIRVGGTLCTSVEALQRFFEALSRADQASAGGNDVNHPRAAPIERELDAAGF